MYSHQTPRRPIVNSARQRSIAYLTILVTSLVFMVGCGQKYIKGTKIKFSKPKQELAQVVEQYRVAVEKRDVATLRKLASLNYYENGSTTTNPKDDYDYNGLEKVLADLKNTVRKVKYEITITDIEVFGKSARVEYEYRSQYLFANGEQDVWATAADKNRLELRKERGSWRILAGM